MAKKDAKNKNTIGAPGSFITRIFADIVRHGRAWQISVLRLRSSIKICGEMWKVRYADRVLMKNFMFVLEYKIENICKSNKNLICLLKFITELLGTVLFVIEIYVILILG